MATIHLPTDFREFLQWLTHHGVEYLLVGGYAVGYHGYPRATGDLDVWVARTPENSRRIVGALQDFGFGGDTIRAELFLQPAKVLRMGLPPMRIEIHTDLSGVDFAEAYLVRVVDDLDGVEVPIIDLEHLKRNKSAAGRAKDLADLEEAGRRVLARDPSRPRTVAVTPGASSRRGRDSDSGQRQRTAAGTSDRDRDRLRVAAR